jgi:DNA-binding response OmpR family regulator
MILCSESKKEKAVAKILIVDDDQDLLDITSEILEAEGYDVSTADNVEDGEKEVKENNPDLILLDIMMKSPDDGIALLHKLRKENVTTPIIMLSGVSQVTGYEYGTCDEALACDDFLEKPVSPSVLIGKIESILKDK